ncbi:MAG: NAD(P)-binding domain-containing protein [Bacteroidetes bacterium]|nr:NAD(P)-binding domain-containing protein [Bacteroidota bacterium]
MNKRVAVIGAGCSGLAAIKNLQEQGVSDIVCYEQQHDLGGNWLFTGDPGHSSVCETTHIISSKKMSEFLDFPMPDHYPDYPSHRQVLDYFRAYADNFGLRKYIRFNTKVETIGYSPKGKENKGTFTIKTADSGEETFDYLLVANGHHSVPRMPELPGNFTGAFLHSHEYKSNAAFAEKQVLVIGAGNSGCDCAVEISRVAEKVSISMRRPVYIIPKFMMGKPTDTYNKLLVKLPKFIRGPIQKMSLRLNVGDYRKYGMENPDYSITSCHPTLNSELLYKIRHGKVFPRKGIKNISGKEVEFADGTKEKYDVILAATGYKITFPFFDESMPDLGNENRIELWLRMMHPDHPNLFFIGLVQPQGCIWPLSDLQARLAAKAITGKWSPPNNIAKLAKEEADQIARDFLHSKRHSLEVHFHPFVNKLLKAGA